MKKMNVKVMVLSMVSVVMLNGCSTMQEASSALGSTGTGVIAGTLAGVGAGVACDKLTGGKNTGACVAAGMVVGAAVGKWAADLDESAEKAVPAMDCKSIKKRMAYSPTASKPKAELKLDTNHPPLVVKPGQILKASMKMNLATPGASGKEENIAFKIVSSTNGESSTGKVLTKECGGDYSLPMSLSSDKEGVFNTDVKLVDATTGTDIDGGVLHFCYTVSNDGKNKCPAS